MKIRTIFLYVVGSLIIIFKGYRYTEDKFSKKVFLSVLSIMITLFALSITENYMTAPTVMICVSVITSLAVGLYWSERAKLLNKGESF